MINCPNCGKKISEFAVNCPHCGKKNTVNVNDAIKVAKLRKIQQQESRKQIILCIPLILTVLSLVSRLELASREGIHYLPIIIAIITSSLLSIGISFLCLQCIKKYNDWKFTDSIVLAISSIKIITFIARSVIARQHPNFYYYWRDIHFKWQWWFSVPKNTFTTTFRFQIISSFIEGGYFVKMWILDFSKIYENSLYLCFCLIPMTLIVFLMIKKRIKVKRVNT